MITEKEKQRLEALLGPFFHMCPLLHFCFNDEGCVVSASHYALKKYEEVFHRSLMSVNILQEQVSIPPVVEAVKERRYMRTVIHFDLKKMKVMPNFTARNADEFISFVVLTMPSCAPDGSFVAHYMLLRDITSFQRENMLNRIAAKKLDLLTQQFSIAHFNYSPKDDTFDVFGGRDKHNVTAAPCEQVMTSIIHPDDREHMLSVLRTIREPGTEAVQFAARVVSNALHCYRLFKFDLIPQYYDDGEFAYYAGFGMDITDQVEELDKQRVELQETIAALRQDKQEAEEKEQGMGALLSCMGHDLRSPLGTIKGFAELLTYTDDPDEKAEYYKVIKSSVEQMTMLVNDILEANRLETGRMNYKIAPFAVGDMMDELYYSHQLRFKELPIELIYHKHEDTLILNSDMQRVLEVMGNFLGNAIKYTEEGSVTLKYEEVDGGVCMHVIDTGRGIAPENHDKVFNRFEMLGSDIKGNGLGLYICREIANGLGGRVGVDSELGRGSDFWIWLPLDFEFVQ